MSNNDVQALTIEELFFGNAIYTIPSYQRNYAWGQAQVEQLINDIDDQRKEDENKNYYVGSLVVDRRQANTEISEYETIDGQQRHTTLCIILAALKHLNVEVAIKTLNLSFECRESSKRTLLSLFVHGEPKGKTLQNLEPSMVNAFNVALKIFKSKFNANELIEFKKFLFKKVIIVRTCVPKDTDLNHYFEIMNNRGEQLEKHEVVKARLMNHLPENEQPVFAQIWDACSDMGHYIPFRFDSKVRTKIFGDDLKQLLTLSYGGNGLFNAVLDKVNSEQALSKNSDTLQASIYQESQSKGNLFNLYSEAKFYERKKNDEQTQLDDRFRSIINFPNFLLHALTLFVDADELIEQKVSLDDKKLIKEFDTYILEGLAEDKCAQKVRRFAGVLLKTRYLFDCYIIKRDLSSPEKNWGVRTLVRKTSEKAKHNVSTVNTFIENSEKLVMLQSMFNVSYPGNSYKHWLANTLRYLFNQEQTIDVKNFIVQLETSAFNQLCSIGKIDTKSSIQSQKELLKQTINCGTSVQNYIFNYLDYKIWLELNRGDFDKVKFSLLGTDDEILLDTPVVNSIKKVATEFKFTNRSSVEHHYPQTSKTEAMDNKLIDTFANLCLVSSSTNSSLGNDYPEGKKKTVLAKQGDKAESLKQRLMFSYKDWYLSNETALTEQASGIKLHGDAMLELLLLPVIT